MKRTTCKAHFQAGFTQFIIALRNITPKENPPIKKEIPILLIPRTKPPKLFMFPAHQTDLCQI